MYNHKRGFHAKHFVDHDGQDILSNLFYPQRQDALHIRFSQLCARQNNINSYI